LSESKINPKLEIIVTVLIFAAFMVILTSEPFPTSTGVHSEFIRVNPGSEIGSTMSKFLWDFRGFDLLFQALILFTTAISCLALLREEIHK
jgi:multisubunit Na+/H+ antiporter MnhB subunit